MTNQRSPIFCCKCKAGKQYRLWIDGGSSGNYILEFCENCFDTEGKEFLLKEEKII
ncbi:MAG: hypothetical protein ACT4N5_05680 [Nitrosopumilaceae archaeon]